MEEMYKNAHAAIRADPVFHKKPPRDDVVPKRYVHKNLILSLVVLCDWCIYRVGDVEYLLLLI